MADTTTPVEEKKDMTVRQGVTIMVITFVSITIIGLWAAGVKLKKV